MSDADFLEADAAFVPQVEEEIKDDTETDSTPETEDTRAGSSDEGVEVDDKDDDKDEESTDETDDKEVDDESADSSDTSSSSSDEDSSDESDEDKDTSEEPDTDDLKAQMDLLLAPFKANGGDMQVKSVDEAIKLMQMGANYTQKMKGLSPSLKVVKLLDKHKLNDPSKISFMIDLMKNDPKAIAKLVKDSGINPLDIDVAKDTEYTTSNHSISEKEMELETVLDEIQVSSPDTYSKTMLLINDKWDDASKRALSETPQIIRTINEHMGNGLFDQISSKMENERMFGRLQGLSDVQAYRQAGELLHTEWQAAEQAKQKIVVAPKIVKPSVSDKKREAQKKSAGASKTSGKKVKAQEINPLSMSDEEFMKNFGQTQN